MNDTIIYCVHYINELRIRYTTSVKTDDIPEEYIMWEGTAKECSDYCMDLRDHYADI